MPGAVVLRAWEAGLSMCEVCAVGVGKQYAIHDNEAEFLVCLLAGHEIVVPIAATGTVGGTWRHVKYVTKDDGQRCRWWRA